jgi:glycosyltransferase involved in cell wall biosynthesis
MRIAIDIKSLRSGNAGIARYLRELISQLQKQDSQNEYLLFSPSAVDLSLVNPLWSIVITNSSLPGVAWQQFQLPKFITKSECDIFWGPEGTSPIFLDKKVAVVSTIHDLTFKRLPQTMSFSNKLILSLLTKATLIRSNSIIAISKFITNELSIFYKEIVSGKVTTIYNGHPDIDISDLPKTVKREPFFLFAGSQEPRKNLIKLIDSFEILKEKYNLTPELIIVGPKGWKNRDLFKAYEKSSVKSQIKFEGFVTEERLQQLYRACSAVIFPSLYEGFGLPVVESLLYKTPLLTSQGSVMEEIAGENGLYFNPKSADSIAERVNRFISDGFCFNEKLREETLRNCSWKKGASELISIFEKVSK